MEAASIRKVLRVWGFFSLFLTERQKRCGNSEKHFFYHGLKVEEILTKNTTKKTTNLYTKK